MFASTAVLTVDFASKQRSSKAGRDLFAYYSPDMDPAAKVCFCT